MVGDTRPSKRKVQASKPALEAEFVGESPGEYGEARPVSLKQRTKDFALRVVRLYAALPKGTVAQVIGKQVLRSGTSVGAHYREAMRARSDAEFTSKMDGGLQELEETGYWFELLAESGIVASERLAPLQEEADQLTSIFISCIRKAKSRKATK